MMSSVSGNQTTAQNQTIIAPVEKNDQKAARSTNLKISTFRDIKSQTYCMILVFEKRKTNNLP